ncbi:MAG: hypothetical protein ABI678_29450, partial [Kofleriaceae bacterium]
MKLRSLLVVALLGGLATAQPSGTPVPNEPGPNGPGLGVPPPAPAPARPPVAIKPPLQLDAKEMTELKDVEAEYDNFVRAADEHDKRMRSIARREYDQRTGELERRFAERIAKSESDQSKRHGDTIALLEKFLQNHPNHETFTPDAMYRLADLYLDQANEELDQRMAAQEAGKTEDQAAMIADYSKSLDLWEQILTKFPAYRQTPAAMYLLAYYEKPKDDRKSLQIFLALACANKYKWNDKPPVIPTKTEAIKRVEQKTLRDPYASCTPYPGAETELV